MTDMNSSSDAHAFGDPSGSTSTVRGKGGNGDSEHGGLIDRVRERATAQLSTQKDRAIDGLGSAARAVRQSTQQLRDQNHETVAGYVEGAADQIERASQRLREKDVSELLEDAQRLARRQPALFVGAAFALGLIGARFLKSSRDDDSDDDDDRYGASYGSSMYTRTGARSTGDWRHRGTGTQYGSTPSGAASPSGVGGGTGAGTSATGTAGTSGIGTAGTGTSRLGDSGRSSTSAASPTSGGRAGTKSSSAGTSRAGRSESDPERY